jgi:hypothetical protein
MQPQMTGDALNVQHNDNPGTTAPTPEVGAAARWSMQVAAKTVAPTAAATGNKTEKTLLPPQRVLTVAPPHDDAKRQRARRASTNTTYAHPASRE